MTSVQPPDLHTNYASENKRALSLSLDADHAALQAWATQLLEALSSVIRDDDTLADAIVRLRNLHPEVWDRFKIQRVSNHVRTTTVWPDGKGVYDTSDGTIWIGDGSTQGGLQASGSGSGGGVSDHGALSGLLDDDHPQYLTEARGDARYPLMGDLDDYTLKSGQALNVRDYGAIGDGSTHPLSAASLANPLVGYASLAAAQVDFPEATSLTDEIDLCAILRCVTLTQTGAILGGTIYFPRGWYRCNRSIDLSGCICIKLLGDGSVWRNYTATAPATWNNAASTLAYVGSTPGPLIYISNVKRNNFYARGGMFEALQFCATDTAGNYLIQYHNSGQGGFFHNCFFGGGDKQIYFSGASEPYDIYFKECHFISGNPVRTPGVEYYPNYCFYATVDVVWGNQSTMLQSCTMRYSKYGHIYVEGSCGLLLQACTLETTLYGPPITIKNTADSQPGYLELSGCHFEGMWANGYWNGTHYQHSAIDATRAAAIDIGTLGSGNPFFLRITNSTSITLRVGQPNPPGTNQVLCVRLSGAGPRAIIDSLGLGGNLKNALVWREDAPNYVDVSRLQGTYAPENGDLYVSGPDATTKRQREVVITGAPSYSAMLSQGVLPPYVNAVYYPYYFTAVHCLMHWQAAGQTPTPPFRFRRDLYLSSPSELGWAVFDGQHKNYTRGDILYFDSWRGGTPAPLGPGTRYAIICAQDASSSNQPGKWQPLFTGPALSADKGDISWDYQHSIDETDMLWSTPLTAHRRVRIGSYSYTIPNGVRVRFVRSPESTGPFDLVLAPWIGTGVLLGDYVDAIRLRPGQWAEFESNGNSTHIGSIWQLVASGWLNNATPELIRAVDAKHQEIVIGRDSRLRTAQEPRQVPPVPDRVPVAPSSFGGFPSGQLAIPANQHRMHHLAAIALGA